MPYLRHIRIKTIAFLLLLVSIFGYTYYQTKNIILGPVISIETPENGSTLETATVDLSGSAKNISKITLNDRPIFIDESGIFKEKLLLSIGYNIITMYAEDKFGRSTKETLELVYN